jgi:3-oxoacyl-[acyl-carrier-protein] synthase-3
MVGRVYSSAWQPKTVSQRTTWINCCSVSKPSIVIAAERCGVPMEKCHTIMEKYGYTGSSCIPVALDDAIELGKIKRGDLVIMISSGLGYNQAAAAVRMTL